MIEEIKMKLKNNYLILKLRTVMRTFDYILVFSANILNIKFFLGLGAPGFCLVRQKTG